MNDEDWTDIDERAASAIRLHLSDDVLNNVIDEANINKIWTKLKSMYMSKMLINKLYMKKQFYAL